MKMLTKEECEKALENLRVLERKDNFTKWGGQVAPQINCDVIEQLIKERFEPQPYKFEDLKVGMLVVDTKPDCEEFTFIKITKILSEFDCEYLYHDKNKKVFFDNMTCHAREFEEGRFFPVTKALEYQE